MKLGKGGSLLILLCLSIDVFCPEIFSEALRLLFICPSFDGPCYDVGFFVRPSVSFLCLSIIFHSVRLRTVDAFWGEGYATNQK